MALTAKITSKGQVTIPKAIRKVLKGDVVEFQVVEDQVILKPVSSVGGALGAYSKAPKSLHEVRERVWEEVVLSPDGFRGLEASPCFSRQKPL